MALRLEVSTMAGSTVNICANPEGSVLDVLLAAENALQHMILQLVTADARVLSKDQEVLTSNLQDGDMLQAVLMSDDDKIRTIAEEHGEFLSADLSGDYVIIHVLTHIWLGDEETMTCLYHLPSLRTRSAAEPLYMAILSYKGSILSGHQLYFVGDQEIQLGFVHDSRMDADDYLDFDLRPCLAKCT